MTKEIHLNWKVKESFSEEGKLEMCSEELIGVHQVKEESEGENSIPEKGKHVQGLCGRRLNNTSTYCEKASVADEEKARIWVHRG